MPPSGKRCRGGCTQTRAARPDQRPAAWPGACASGRGKVEATHIGGTIKEDGIVGAVEPAPELVGLEVKVSQDPPDLRRRDASSASRSATSRADQWLSTSGRWVVTVATIFRRAS